MFKVKDQEMQKVIEGKKIIILGSAPSVLLNKGSEIDAFDYVVRLNNYKIDGFEKNVGTRTDIYYSFFGRSIKKENEELKRHKVKFIMNKYPNQTFWDHTGGKAIVGISDECKWVYKLRKDWWEFPVWIQKRKYFRENYEYMCRIPTTGVSAILDVLRFKPGLLHITGFDFMTSKIHNTNEKWNDGDGNHDHFGEMKLISLLVSNDKITCDNFIKDLILQHKGETS